MKRIWLGIVNFVRKLVGRPHKSVVAPSPCPAAIKFSIVTGPAGTGKTALMRAEIAERLKSANNERILAITPSEREATELMSHQGYDPSRHFFGTARALMCSLLPDSQLSTDEDITGTVLNHLDSGIPLPDFSHILIDEAQNISPATIRIIEKLAHENGCSLTCYLDPSQAIFGFAGANSETLALIRARAGNRVVRLKMRRRPMPVILPELTAPDIDSIIELAATKAASLLTDDTSVAILTRTNNEAAQTASLLAKRGTPHVLLSARLVAAQNPIPEGDMPLWRYFAMRHADHTPTLPDGCTVATVHTFRDRTAHHVIVLDTALRQPNTDIAAEQRRINTGIARATRSAVVIRFPGRDFNYFTS